MSEIPTPRTDQKALTKTIIEKRGTVNDQFVNANFARTLERELAEARRQIELDTANVTRIQNACIALEVERDSLRQQLSEANRHLKDWVEQHGIEAEKRGEAEHQVDLARGDKAQAFENLERERDQLHTQNTKLRELLAEAKKHLNWAHDEEAGVISRKISEALNQPK